MVDFDELLLTHDYFRKQLLADRMASLQKFFSTSYSPILERLAPNIVEAKFVFQIIDLWKERQYEEIVDTASLIFLKPGMMFEALLIDLFKCMALIMLKKEDTGILALKSCFENAKPPITKTIDEMVAWLCIGLVLGHSLILTNDFETSLNITGLVEHYSKSFMNLGNKTMHELNEKSLALIEAAKNREIPSLPNPKEPIIPKISHSPVSERLSFFMDELSKPLQKKAPLSTRIAQTKLLIKTINSVKSERARAEISISVSNVPPQGLNQDCWAQHLESLAISMITESKDTSDFRIIADLLKRSKSDKAKTLLSAIRKKMLACGCRK